MPHAGEIRLLSGVVLLVLELAAPGAFMMWVGIAAIGAGGMTLAADPPFAAQVIVFAVLAACAVGIGLLLRRRSVIHVNTPASGLVGRSAVALSFRGREGRVRVGDSDWPARLAYGSEEAEPGWMMEVAGVEGVVLIVRKKGSGPLR